MCPVFFTAGRVPGAAAHPLDQGRTDAIPLDGERVAGVRRVEPVEPFENGVDAAPAFGRGGKAVEDGAAHRVPHQAYALRHGGGVPAKGEGRGRRLEGVAFAHAEIGRAHRLGDVVRDPLPTEGAEGGGQATGDRAAMAAVEEAAKQGRRIGHEGERGALIDRVQSEEPGRARDQRGREAERAHSVQGHDFLSAGRQYGADFGQGRPVGQRGDLVAPLVPRTRSWRGTVRLPA